jgi:hypothetical protein
VASQGTSFRSWSLGFYSTVATPRTTKKLRVLIPEPKAIAAMPQILEQSNLLGCRSWHTVPGRWIRLDRPRLCHNSAHPEFSSWLSEDGRVLIWDTKLYETDRLDQLFTAGLLYYSPNTQTHIKSSPWRCLGYLNTNICRTSVIQIGQGIHLTRWCK